MDELGTGTGLTDYQQAEWRDGERPGSGRFACAGELAHGEAGSVLQWQLTGAVKKAGDWCRGFIALVLATFTEQLFFFFPHPGNLQRPNTKGRRL